MIEDFICESYQVLEENIGDICVTCQILNRPNRIFQNSFKKA